jgi:hypothetical protein
MCGRSSTSTNARRRVVCAILTNQFQRLLSYQRLRVRNGDLSSAGSSAPFQA